MDLKNITVEDLKEKTNAGYFESRTLKKKSTTLKLK